jgi:hypothetical protein
VVATVKNRHLMTPPQGFTRHGQTDETGTTQEQDSHLKPPDLTPAHNSRIQLFHRAIEALSGLNALFRRHVPSQASKLSCAVLRKARLNTVLSPR